MHLLYKCLLSVHGLCTVISQGLHSQLVMRNEGILKNGTEFFMKTGGKKDFS